MRTITIGRNPQEVNLVLPSEYVSGHHADILQLDNGDMFLVDRSTNGTFIDGYRTVRGREISIRRGDAVTFADTPLDWSKIPDIQIPKEVRQMRSIGSHFMNDIVVSGAKVSKFHATARKMSDRKWYLCDHSENGTGVNGEKIPKNTYVRIRRGDRIICGDIPIQNPIPPRSDVWKTVLLAGAAVCIAGTLLLGLIMAISK